MTVRYHQCLEKSMFVVQPIGWLLDPVKKWKNFIQSKFYGQVYLFWNHYFNFYTENITTREKTPQNKFSHSFLEKFPSELWSVGTLCFTSIPCLPCQNRQLKSKSLTWEIMIWLLPRRPNYIMLQNILC